MQTKLSLSQLPLKDKKVLMRVDFNVPLDNKGAITDDTRIRASLPSIQYVLDQGGALILMSHLGRPKDKKVAELSLAPTAKRLEELIGKKIEMAPDCVGPEVEKLAHKLAPGQILMLENLRFHRGEEHPDEDQNFVKQLASLGNVYVNDAFGTAHRAHASTAVIAKFFPEASATGFLLEKEIKFLGAAFDKPKHPFYAIIGGAKISTKFGVLKALIKKVDALLIGGGMAYTFFKAQGISIGDSIHEDDQIQEAKELIKLCEKANVKLLLPIDIVVADKPVNGAKTEIVKIQDGIPNRFQGVDIGPETIQLFKEQLKNGSLIFWNGPLGIFEQSEFAKGTDAIAKTLAQSKATTIVGGGDSIAAIQAAGLADKITHVSTGGGATLEYIEYGKLPGIEALSNVKKQ